VPIDVRTHRALVQLADDLGATVGQAVTVAVRSFRHRLMGRDLATPLRDDEVEWLEAELGGGRHRPR
jgi:hypothetical protein